MLEPNAVIAEQVFGFVGLALIAASWQFNDRKTILLLNVSAFVAFALGLYILGAIVGAIMMVFAVVLATSALFSLGTVPKVLIVALPVAISLFRVEHPHDVLPILAHITGAIAFYSKGLKQMRKWSPTGTVFWAIHNFIVGAWGQFLADLFILTSMALGAYRHRDR